MNMKFLKWCFIILVLLLGLFYREFYTIPGDRKESTVFEISSGESFKKVATRLEEQNLNRGDMLYRIYAKILGLDTEIKAGRFRLDPNLTPRGILRFLVSPENGEISVTIPEGYSIFDIDKRLVSLGLIQKNEFVAWVKGIDATGGPVKAGNAQISSVEGFFFPDTYFVFSKNFHPSDLVNAMSQNFEKKVFKGLEEELKKSKRTLVEIVTMASILEKEVRTREDYPIVAGILWKRLDNNWPLQADATLLYAKKDRSLSVEELRNDSPYNTYTRQGLPITPIGNPGLETIKAALNPVNSPYWFYLTADDGKVIYARTNEEHNENKRKYL